MVKQTPEWFGKNQLAFAIGVLSLSFVFGGAVAVYIAGLIAQYSQDNWHAIMGMPSAILLLLICFCWYVLPPGEVEASSRRTQRASKPAANFRLLFFDPQFYIICALSFVLTFLRETFNFWTVDFVKTEGGKMVSNSSAAFFSTPFDVMGGLGIVLLGWIYSRIGYRARTRLLFASLSLLSGILFVTPEFFHYGLWAVTLSVGLIGFLVYGPYSLLAGVLSVEVRGKEYAATVSGWVDGIGYFAAVLSGVYFGRLLTQGGYRLGFHVMSVLALVSAALCLFLYPKSKFKDTPSEDEPIVRTKATKYSNA
jgi:sugar phosphate permease